jgi:hypothetical protein
MREVRMDKRKQAVEYTAVQTLTRQLEPIEFRGASGVRGIPALSVEVARMQP